MKIRVIILLVFVLVSFLPGIAQETNKLLLQGNEQYRQNQFDQAEATYKQVLLMEPGNTTAAFNQANSLIRQDRSAEALVLLDQVIMNSDDPLLKAKAYYNKGVIFSGQQRLEESIEAYKNSLRQNPDDKEVRENLQKALLELKKRTPPPPKKEDKKKQQQKPQKQPQKMNEKEAEQRLKLLEQKEKELQQRIQDAKSKSGSGRPKDW